MDILEIYNPANAKNLTEEQILAMRDLTDDQIEELARAYPNQPTGNAYLVYYIKSDGDKQRFPLGTWKNLHSLRKLGKKDILPFSFKNGAKGYQVSTASVKTNQEAKTRVIDISKDDKIEGLKNQGGDNTNQVVSRLEEVKHINSIAIPETFTTENAMDVRSSILDELQGLDNIPENSELISELDIYVKNLNEFIAKKSNKSDNADKDNTLLNAVIEAEAELEKAKSEQAHHMTIKSLEKKVADAKAAAGL